MSKRTIAKISAFVILTASFTGAFSSCGHGPLTEGRPPVFDEATSPYQKPETIGQIKSGEVTESSGLAVSLCHPNVFWTHNDSGDGPYIYAFDASGANLGTWKVKNADNTDWEDMAVFKDETEQCFLYIGDIGNTEKLERSEHIIYRIKEPAPDPRDADSTTKNARQTEPADVMRYKYAGASHDAETLAIHPKTGDIYILTKHRNKASSVYKLQSGFNTGGVTEAKKIAELKVPAIPNGLLTGGSISPDGTRVVVCDYTAAYEIILPSAAAAFDDIWSQTPVAIDLGSRKQGETVSYSGDGLSIFATSEKRNPPIIKVKRRPTE